MFRKISLLFLVMAAALVTAWSISPVTGDSPADPVVVDETAAAAGYRAIIDPATGEFVSKPGAGTVELDKDMLNKFSTSSEGLEVKRSPVSGEMVDLQGRFQGSHVATIDANGKLTSRHIERLPEDDDTPTSEGE